MHDLPRPGWPDDHRDQPPAPQPCEASAPDAPLEDRLVDAAIELIVRDGYAALTLHALADAVGVDRSVVLDAFPDEPAVLIAAFRHYEGRHIAPYRPPVGGSVESELIALLDYCAGSITLDSAMWRTAWALWFEMWTLGLHDETVRAALREADRETEESIATIIRRGQANGVYGRADPELAAALLNAMIDGLGLRAVRGDISRARMNAELVRYASFLLPPRLPGPGDLR